MFNSIVLSHNFIKRVPIPASHKQDNHSGALPPGVLFATALREQQSCREADSYGLSCAGSLEADKLADTISQREQSKEIEEGN